MSSDTAAEFRAACGIESGLRLTVSRPGKDPEQISLSQPFALLGSEPANDVVFEHASVSRRHAYVQAISGRCYCVDLGSRTGLVWNDTIQESGWIEPSDEVYLGPFRFQATAEVGESSALVPVTSGEWDPVKSREIDPKLLPPLTVEIHAPGFRTRQWKVSRVLTFLGQSSGCKLCLPVADVSRYHCSLVATPTGFWVVDLLSQTGTWVNDERVKFASIQEGDELRIGQVLIRIGADMAPAVMGEKRVVAVDSGTPRVKPPPPLSPPSSEDESKDLVLAVVEQFNVMQAQMFDQFNQMVLMLAKEFGKIHQSQLKTIRAELDRLQALNSELTTLRTEMATRPARESAETQGEPSPSTQSGPGEPSGSTQSGKPRTAKSKRPPQRKSSASSPSRQSRKKSEPADQEVHAWLSDRIEALEKERQSRWQKVVGFLRGE